MLKVRANHQRSMCSLRHLHPAELHRHGGDVVPAGHGEEEGAGDADALVGEALRIVFP